MMVDAGSVADSGRCWWTGNDPAYQHYHDTEWGVPVTDDMRLFEKICLEGFQAGLSWLTVLRKREHFRHVFHDFHFDTIASFGVADVERLLQDPGIIRHRGKIEATINNARCAQALIQEAGTLSAFFWRYEPGDDERPADFTPATLKIHTSCASAHRLARDLRKRGWRFVGPTTIYAFMQAMGMVNDHVVGCPCREPLLARRMDMGRVI